MNLEPVKIDCLGNSRLAEAAYNTLVKVGYKPFNIPFKNHPVRDGDAFLLTTQDNRIAFSVRNKIGSRHYKNYCGIEVDSIAILKKWKPFGG